MPMKDKSVVKESKQPEIPDLVWNEKTNRWVKKDGAVGKQIEEKKKAEQEQEEKDKKVAKERKRERDAAKQEKEELQSENKRFKSLVVPSLLAASYVAPCVHHFADSRPEKRHSRVCNICGKEWELMVKSKPVAKTERLVAAIANATMTAGVNSPFLETIAENELEEAARDMKPARRVGKSGLSSGLTGDFGSMSVQKDAPKKGQGRAGCWGK